MANTPLTILSSATAVGAIAVGANANATGISFPPITGGIIGTSGGTIVTAGSLTRSGFGGVTVTPAADMPVKPVIITVFHGGPGDDVYSINNQFDVVVEDVNAGNDTVNATVYYRLSPNVENLVLLGSVGLQGYGNDLANTITGNAGNDLIDGDTGADTMFGGAGNDTYFVDNSGDVVIENANEGNDTVFSAIHLALQANVENLVLQGGADLQGYGNGLANMLRGNAGSNVLNGEAGADTMYGLAGDDAYFVDNAADGVIESASEGADTVYASVHFRLPANVEHLVLLGSADLQGYGNNLANSLYGNAGTNILNGGGGADAMYGLAGSDAYFVDSAGDAVVENADEGADTVYASVHFRLPENVENLVLQGSADLQGYGNGQANSIYANSGNNLLDGGAGADTMYGLAGDDVFFVDSAGDFVVENANEGNDAIFTSLDYVLPANVENLVFENAAGHWGMGNALANGIFGNIGDDVLDGGGGADLLVGNLGRDAFLFTAGQADGDIVADFDGQGPAMGDYLIFVGYGVGANLTQNDATHWQVNYNSGASHEVITFSNAASIGLDDVFFV
jgi:Ca2+-binding RTX toxin-like protein